MNTYSIENIIEKVRSYVEKSLPGVYQLLDQCCKQYSSRNCISLLIEEPSVFKDVLIRVYGLQPGIELVVRIYLTPLVLEIDHGCSVDDLITLFINNISEFKKIISSLIKK